MYRQKQKPVRMPTRSRYLRLTLSCVGIRQQRSKRRCPWQNGRVERSIGTLKRLWKTGMTPAKNLIFLGGRLIEHESVDSLQAKITDMAASRRLPPRVRTVWQLDAGEVAPRLITTYPLEASHD